MPLIEWLKTDLGITSMAYDSRLHATIEAAKELITREGITLNLNSFEDGQLVVMYAAWMWRRRDTMDAMPRMLRYALNNRVFAGKANG